MKKNAVVLSSFTTFSLVVSWTCFTFYSAIVVPIGTDLFDPIHQGLITRQVTNWLNVITGVYVVTHLAEMIMIPTPRPQILCWALIGLSLITLVLLHPYLDAMIDVPQMDVTDGRRFYPGHRAYLWVSTFGWLAGGWLIALRLFRNS